MTRDFEDFPMVVWSQLFFEAQDAGYLGWVSLTFDDWGDSAGVPWAGTAQKLTVSAGDNLLDLLKRWCETNEFAWRMLPGFVLEVRQAAGVHHENEVVFTQWRSQGEHKRKISRRELANVVFADSGDNGLAFAEDGDSAAKWRKRFAWLSAGDAADASARSMIANSSLSLSKDQRLSRSVRIVPDREGRHPFVDFDLHDWIGVEVPDDETESGARKVLGLAVDIDAGGTVEYEATLQSRFEARAVKTQRILDKLGGSSRSGAGGKSSSPIPVSKAISAVKFGDLTDVDLTAPAAGSLVNFSGGRWVDVVPNLDLLADVDTVGTPPANGQALVFDTASGLWKPGTVASGGGGGGGQSTTFPIFAGSVTGTDSGGTYPGTTTNLTVRAVMKLTGIDFYAIDAGTYTLRIDGAVVGSPLVLAAGTIGQFTFPEVTLAIGVHTVGVSGGSKKARYANATPSIVYNGPGYDFTASGWIELAGNYTIPFVYRGTGEVITGALADVLWRTAPVDTSTATYGASMYCGFGFFVSAPAKVKKFKAYITATAGIQYKLQLVKMTGETRTISELKNSALVTAAASGGLMLEWANLNWQLEVGARYALIYRRNDATNVVIRYVSGTAVVQGCAYAWTWGPTIDAMVHTSEPAAGTTMANLGVIPTCDVTLGM
jgi:hypothetical protein